jgi:hypothetical protein
VKTYKGFDKDLKCNGFPFEVGKEYQETDIKLCKKGFHSCKNPLDVLKYYGPAGNRFCEVESDGKIIEATDDTKICAEKIKIETEINLKSIIDLGIKFLFEKIKISKLGYYSHAATSGKYSPAATSGDSSHAATSGDSSHAATSGYSSHAATSGNYSPAATSGKYSPAATSGDYSPAATSGYYSHAATSGDSSHAATSGYYSHAATSGDYSHAATSGNYSPAATSGDSSHAATSGYYSPAATSGYYSHAATSGKNSIAVAIGKNSKAKSTTGNWIVCSEYDSDGNVKTVKTVKVDGKKIKADTWYTLKNGKFTRVK